MHLIAVSVFNAYFSTVMDVVLFVEGVFCSSYYSNLFVFSTQPSPVRVGYEGFYRMSICCHHMDSTWANRALRRSPQARLQYWLLGATIRLKAHTLTKWKSCEKSCIVSAALTLQRRSRAMADASTPSTCNQSLFSVHLTLNRIHLTS